MAVHLSSEHMLAVNMCRPSIYAGRPGSGFLQRDLGIVLYYIILYIYWHGVCVVGRAGAGFLWRYLGSIDRQSGLPFRRSFCPPLHPTPPSHPHTLHGRSAHPYILHPPYTLTILYILHPSHTLTPSTVVLPTLTSYTLLYTPHTLHPPYTLPTASQSLVCPFSLDPPVYGL